MANNKKLETARAAAAQQEFEAYDFEEYVVADVSGFEWSSGSDEMTRPIFIEDSDNADGPSVLAHFTVVFDEGSANITMCYASLAGNDIGKRPEESPAPGTP